MPVASSRQAISRQWELLKSIPRRPPGLTPAELASRLEGLGYAVDVRTVQRDLNNLSALFPLLADESAKPYRWSWADGSELDVPGIELGDAVSLKLMEAFLRPLLPASIVSALAPRFELAGRKLAELAGSNAAARWLDKVHVALPALGLQPPMIGEGVLEQVQAALFADRQLLMDYRSAASGGETRPLRVHPLALVQRGAVSYLVATIGDYQDPRLLALHRMDSVRRTEESSRVPQDFSLEAFVASGALEFGDGATPVIRLQAWVHPDLARHLQETPMSADMKLTPTPEEDGFTLRATVRDTWQLRWWLLSQGAQIVVRSPAALRRGLRECLREALAGYEE
jgi:predicted DNA-binding transcriptional regulator YafY